MFQTKKTLLKFCFLLLLLLIILCLFMKLTSIYNEVMPQSSKVLITKQDSKVVVKGTFMSNELVGKTIDKFKMFSKDVKKGDIDIDNNIQKSDKWQSTMQNVAPYFSAFKEGKLSFDKNKLTINGSTYSKKTKDDISSLLAKLKSQGVEVKSDIKLLEPKYSDISIVKKDSKVVVNGTFSSQESVDKTISKLKMFNDDVQKGDIKIDKEISKNDKWHDVMQNISYYFSKNLEDGELSFAKNKLSLDGSTLSPIAKEDFLVTLDRLKSQGVDVVSSKFTLLEPKTDRQRVKKDIYELLHSKTIEFQTGKSTIKDESFPILDHIVEKLKAFSELNVLIEGHTDDVGEDESNEKLSEDRAMAIKEYFLQQGIDGNRLSTMGYGEYRPAFPNSSAENRQKNRRVEFKVKGE